VSGPGWLLGSLVALVGVAILAAIIFSFMGLARVSGQDGIGIVRAMLSLVLVGGLIILAGASFSMGDVQTRNLLIGGLVASTSAAVAFYFASRGAQDARRDLLSATLGTETVPKLVDLTVSQAQAAMSSGALVLKLPEPVPAADATVATQDIAAGTSVPRGTPVTVTV
jgi:PASTA domain